MLQFIQAKSGPGNIGSVIGIEPLEELCVGDVFILAQDYPVEEIDRQVLSMKEDDAFYYILCGKINEYNALCLTYPRYESMAKNIMLDKNAEVIRIGSIQNK